MTTWATIPSVRVADMAGALRFYREVLGFDVLSGGPDDSNCSLQGNWLTFWQAADPS